MTMKKIGRYLLDIEQVFYCTEYVRCETLLSYVVVFKDHSKLYFSIEEYNELEKLLLSEK